MPRCRILFCSSIITTPCFTHSDSKAADWSTRRRSTKLGDNQEYRPTKVLAEERSSAAVCCSCYIHVHIRK
jgi:hypothetical protein